MHPRRCPSILRPPCALANVLSADWTVISRHTNGEVEDHCCRFPLVAHHGGCTSFQLANHLDKLSCDDRLWHPQLAQAMAFVRLRYTYCVLFLVAILKLAHQHTNNMSSGPTVNPVPKDAATGEILCFASAWEAEDRAIPPPPVQDPPMREFRGNTLGQSFHFRERMKLSRDKPIMGFWYGAFPYPNVARVIAQAGFE